MRTFLFNYTCDGAEYALRVPAESREMALARVRRMSTAIYQGEVFFRVHGSLGWFAKAMVAVRNRLLSTKD